MFRYYLRWMYNGCCLALKMYWHLLRQLWSVNWRMEHFGRRRWTTILALSVSYSLNPWRYRYFVSALCASSQVDLPPGRYGCSSPSTKVLHDWRLCWNQFKWAMFETAKTLFLPHTANRLSILNSSLETLGFVIELFPIFISLYFSPLCF